MKFTETVYFTDLKDGDTLRQYRVISDVNYTDKTFTYYDYDCQKKTYKEPDDRRYCYERELSTEQVRTKFAKEEADAREGLQNELYFLEGYKEWDNSWLYCHDCFGAKCAEDDIKIVGYYKFTDECMIEESGGIRYDIAIVAEDYEGKRFWCHYSDELRLKYLNS